MSAKSKIACQGTMEFSAGKNKIAYLWTFTFPFVFGSDCKPAAELWRRFIDHAQKVGLLETGVRVFEFHKNGALHIHAVVFKRYWVVKVRALWRKYQGGRVHVKPIPTEKMVYLCKYLGKRQQKKAPKGMRMWSCWGKATRDVSVRVKDVTIDTMLLRAFRWSRPVLKTRLKTLKGADVHKMDKRTYNRNIWEVWVSTCDEMVLLYINQGGT